MARKVSTASAVGDDLRGDSMEHEQRVKDFLSERAPDWANEKDRGWHFDNPEDGDRYFAQIREHEVSAFHLLGSEADNWAGWRVEYQAALAADRPVDFESPRDEVARVRVGNRYVIESIHEQPRLTPPQRIAKRMVELAQGAYGHLDVAELASLAQARPRRREQPKVDGRDAAYLLRTGFGLSEKKAAAILQQEPTKVHTDVYRLAQALPDDFKQRLVEQFEARLHRKPIVVGLPTLPADRFGKAT